MFLWWNKFMKLMHPVQPIPRISREPRAARPQRTCSRERGQSMIELALLLPIMLLITIGVIEFGRAAYYYIEVVDAAKAGAQYGSQTMANAVNTPNILLAAQADATDIGANLTIPMTVITCTCPGTGVSSPCGGALGCPYPTVYLTVNTAYTLNTLFQYPGIPTQFNISGLITTMVQRQ
jgi:Flp pilus assembly protein TadG